MSLTSQLASPGATWLTRILTACGSWHWDLFLEQAYEVGGLETRRDVWKEVLHTDGQTVWAEQGERMLLSWLVWACNGCPLSGVVGNAV